VLLLLASPANCRYCPLHRLISTNWSAALVDNVYHPTSALLKFTEKDQFNFKEFFLSDLTFVAGNRRA
jgi:hypothetical protein